ncbi:3-keto-disaccharide hydrolase [Cyclobacterium plantarum]|uniref:3-keto-disaccharide hydrolase n=1 Tax=Cyclobacterium plantarum TaxID=2716263 RepID=UPI003F7253DD
MMKYRKHLVFLLVAVCFSLPVSPSLAQSNGYEMLFDGSSVEKWRSKQSSSFPEKGWKVADGQLFLDSKGGGDIITREKFSDFELVFEFNLTAGANSGIKYFVDTIYNEKTGKMMVNGPEYQIIDDFNYPGIKEDPNGLSSTAAAYLFYPPKNKTLRPHGEWNTGKIVARGNKVTHWLNGKKVVTYQRGSRDFLNKKQENKFKDDARYGELEEGHILLTDHGDKVYFRNIKIKKP